jgi:hypothetical protein
MINLDSEIKVKRIQDWVTIWFLGDEHLGSTACAENRLVDTMQEIVDDPNSYVYRLGDPAEFINISDPRFDIEQVKESLRGHIANLARESVRYYLNKTSRIASKTLGMVPGNHDGHNHRRYHYDVCRDIAEGIGCPLLSTMSQVRIRVTDGTRSYIVKGVLSHAERNAEDEEAKMRIAKKLANNFTDIDFFAQAHMHGYKADPFIFLDTAGAFKHGGNPETIEREVWVFLTGGYLRTYAHGPSGYGERRGYRPCKLGSPRLKMRLNRGTKDRRELVGVS